MSTKIIAKIDFTERGLKQLKRRSIRKESLFLYEQIKLTDREPFTKSLRFELVPVLETRTMIDQKHLLEADHQLS